MNELVIDASVAAVWCFTDETTDYTNSILQALSTSWKAIAPRLWAYEVRNSVIMSMRRKRITRADAEDFLDSLKHLLIRLTDPLSYDNVFTLADRHSLTVYDAAYLDIALREGLPLASFDKELIRATNSAGVPVFQL